jgi:predicted nucleic-acid-binding protein
MLLKKNASFFVPDIVLVEVDWVLSTLYHWTPDEVTEAFGRLLTVHNLIFENEGRIRSALRALRQGADLSDEIIVNRWIDMGCKTLASYDKGMLKRNRGFVVSPG